MPVIIHKEAVTDLPWGQLKVLMQMQSLGLFRLVGGTALSLLGVFRSKDEIYK